MQIIEPVSKALSHRGLVSHQSFRVEPHSNTPLEMEAAWRCPISQRGKAMLTAIK